MQVIQKPKQPWLHSAVRDGIFILSPPFIAILLVILFPAQFQIDTGMPVLYWLVLVVFIDVAHVYSTLYRTYFNPGKLKQQSLLVSIPVACYIGGVLFHSFDAMLFWRVLAYLAVFHFIRQQYGFMRLYSIQENSNDIEKLVDKVAIYTATIYPIAYWHLEGNRRFNWFIENDFVLSPSADNLLQAILAIYILVIIAYLIKEVKMYRRTRMLNQPRNLLIAGTFISWFFGIVYFNGDMAFTTLNVISHGIPYMALIWITEEKRMKVTDAKHNSLMKVTFSKYGILLFILLIAGLAYIEEGLWDGLIWKEHSSVFSVFSKLPHVADEQLLSFLVPLLALPQSVHYVLDGFIWKAKSSIDA